MVSLSNHRAAAKREKYPERKLSLPYWVYILRCADDSLYTGRTSDIDRRISEHALGIGSKYTIRRRPVELLSSWVFETEDQAYVVEHQIKGWTRAKKLALVNGDFDLLVELSRNRTERRDI